MNLFDPLRPLSPLNQPTWLRNHIIIPKLELRPLESGEIEISIWLPIKGETFASKRYTTIIEPIFLSGLIKNFVNDPEETCEYLFQSEPDDMQPELRKHQKMDFPSPNPSEARVGFSQKSTNSNSSLRRKLSPIISGIEF